MINPTLRAVLAAFALTLLALLVVPAAAADKPVIEAELAAHIAVLADDAFEGRGPGTAGEARTIAHVVATLARAGLEPLAGSATPWLQPVPLIERRATVWNARFAHGRGSIDLPADGVALLASSPSVALDTLPLVDTGYGVNADGKVVADVAGKIAVMRFGQPPFAANAPRQRDRVRLLAAAGAEAVLVVVGDNVPWTMLTASLTRASTVLASASGGDAPIAGFLAQESWAMLQQAAGLDAAAQAAAIDDAGFAGATLPLTASLTAEATFRAYDSHNIIARLPGARPDGKLVLMLGHWDHLGVCRPEGAPDRICNGAVDNASGIAVMLAVADRLASGRRPDRDVILMATTAEEKGLLGAYHFAANLPVPANQIVVALNVDTVAIAPRGAPVAVIGRGKAPYDAAVARVAAKLDRAMDNDGEADAFARRQDGWALAQTGITTLMAGGSFSDMTLLQTFLGGPYHKPEDQPGDAVELGGAADDADLHIALIRHFGNRADWPGTAAAD